MNPLQSLLDRWQQEAEILRAHGATEAANTKERDARQLQEALTQHDLETLTIREAAQESGYSQAQLRRLVSQGKLPRGGIPRGALPRKPHLEAS